MDTPVTSPREWRAEWERRLASEQKRRVNDGILSEARLG